MNPELRDRLAMLLRNTPDSAAKLNDIRFDTYIRTVRELATHYKTGEGPPQWIRNMLEAFPEKKPDLHDPDPQLVGLIEHVGKMVNGDVLVISRDDAGEYQFAAGKTFTA